MEASITRVSTAPCLAASAISAGPYETAPPVEIRFRPSSIARTCWTRAYSPSNESARPSARTSFAAARPPMEVAVLRIWFWAPWPLRWDSNCSRAIPGPQSTSGIWSLKTSRVSLATRSKKPRRTLVESTAFLPPPRMENCETSRIPWAATSKMVISSDSTTTSPHLARRPADRDSLRSDVSARESPPSRVSSISDPGLIR